MVICIVLSVIATALAVGTGVLAAIRSREGQSADRWTLENVRSEPMSQTDQLREGIRRHIARQFSMRLTDASAAWWLAASALAAAASTAQAQTHGSFGVFLALATIAGTPATILSFGRLLTRRQEARRQADRVAAVEIIERESRDPNQPPKTVEEQLRIWSSCPDLAIFVMIANEHQLTICYKGRLVYKTTGIPAHTIEPVDWDLGPLDSMSPIRGWTVNLHHRMEHATWQPGNGFFGARCSFETRKYFVQPNRDFQPVGMKAIVQTIDITDHDPFEVMPFLRGPGSALGR